MKIVYTDFSDFVDRIVALDNTRDKTRVQKNAAFEIRDDSEKGVVMIVSFGDTVNSIYQVVPIYDYIESNIVDEAGKIIFVPDFEKNQRVTVSLDRLKEIANLFKPTGSTKVSSIEVFKEVKDGEIVPNSLIFKCEKYIEVDHENGSDEKEIEVTGSFEQAIRWDDAGVSIKNAIYQRISIDDILNESDETSQDTDIWNASEFKELISKLSADNNRLTLVSSARKVGYVDNVSYSMLINLKDFDFKNTLVLSSAVDSQLCAILSKLKGDICVYPVNDESILRIHTEDKSVAMSFSTGRADQKYVLGMTKIASMDFKGIQCTMYTDAVKDIVNNLSSILSSKGDSTVGAEVVVSDTGSFILFDNVKSQTGSHENTFKLNIQSVRRQDDAVNNIRIKIPVNIVQKILSNIKTSYVTFDIEFTDESHDNMTLRIAEIDVNSQKAEIDKVLEEYKTNNLESGETVNPAEVLTNDVMMTIRKKAVGLAGFISVKSK